MAGLFFVPLPASSALARMGCVQLKASHARGEGFNPFIGKGRGRARGGCIYFLMGLAVLLGGASAQEMKTIAIPPPLANAGAATVYLNERVEVTLSVGGRVTEPLSFLIRKPPRSGSLGIPRRVGRKAATVTYTPAANAVAGDDVFTFAAQSSDSPVSAPASVWIRLVERPPVLELPDSLDFGTVSLGEKSERELVVKNSGGGRATGEFVVNPPWSVAGNSTFAIPPGGEARVRLVFSPDDTRDFRDRVRLRRNQQVSVELQGRAEAPLEWPKEGLVFSPGQREAGFAEISIANHSPQDRTATFAWPAFVKAPDKILVPAQASVTVRAEVVGAITQAVQADIPIQSGNFSGRIPLTVFLKPAKLAVVPAAELDLGETQKGRELRGKFTVKNIGEASAPLAIVAPEGMQVVPDPANAILRAGEERDFEIFFSSFKPGPVSGTLSVRASPGEPVQTTVRASVSEKASLPVKQFLNIPAKQPDLPSDGDPPLVPSGKVSPPESAELVLSTAHEIEIAWNPSPSGDYGYRIQRRQISSGKEGQVVVEWIDWPLVKIGAAGGKVTARWENLAANTFWSIRIIALDAAGTPGIPSPTFRIWTKPSRGVAIPAWVWIVVLAGAIAGGVRMRINRRKALIAREDERLAQVEAGMVGR